MKQQEARQMVRELDQQRRGNSSFRVIKPGILDDEEHGWVVAEHRSDTQWSPGERTLSVTSGSCLEPGDMTQWATIRLDTAEFESLWHERAR